MFVIQTRIENYRTKNCVEACLILFPYHKSIRNFIATKDMMKMSLKKTKDETRNNTTNFLSS